MRENEWWTLTADKSEIKVLKQMLTGSEQLPLDMPDCRKNLQKCWSSKSSFWQRKQYPVPKSVLRKSPNNGSPVM